MGPAGLLGHIVGKCKKLPTAHFFGKAAKAPNGSPRARTTKANYVKCPAYPLIAPPPAAVPRLFIELFSNAFGAEKAGYLYSHYSFSDIYQNSRFANFLIENDGRKAAMEIDDEVSHNPRLIFLNKFCDDLHK